MADYEETEKFWDNIFNEYSSGFNADEPLPYEWMEEALDWLTEPGCRIIDFGCGCGKLLLRAAAKNASYIMGIDISSIAIKICKENASNCKVSNRFLKGGVNRLRAIPNSDFHAGLLFNIMDNMMTKDSHELLTHFKRILKPGGKLLVKLNRYNDPDELRDRGAKKVSKDLFLEEGLYLWNLKDEHARKLLERYFEVVNGERVYYTENTDHHDRIYYLMNV